MPKPALAPILRHAIVSRARSALPGKIMRRETSTATEAAVYVACSTLCFARYPLDQALRIIGELDFSKVDVAIHEKGQHLRPSEVASDVAAAAQRIRIGPSLSPAAFSVEIDSADERGYEQQLRSIC